MNVANSNPPFAKFHEVCHIRICCLMSASGCRKFTPAYVECRGHCCFTKEDCDLLSIFHFFLAVSFLNSLVQVAALSYFPPFISQELYYWGLREDVELSYLMD
uniref:Uncharacterized protein n=1 Tax=Opuntia streptacantha TaxID=393608 RepID=A0A7C9ALA0_OPUST